MVSLRSTKGVDRAEKHPNTSVCNHAAVTKVYYVTMDGDRVEGPYDTHAEAKRTADELNTHEVNMEYRVEGVEGEEE